MAPAQTTRTQPGASGPAAPASAAPVVACQGLSKVVKDFWLRSRAKAVDIVAF